MDLAERLKEIRGVVRYTQKQMGAALSVTVQMYQAYEAGKNVPGGNVLKGLAGIGFNVNWLLTGKGEMRLGESNTSREPVVQVEETFQAEMYLTLQACANATEMNGPASYMLAQELVGLSKPMGAVTLDELQAALDRADVRYHRMMNRLRNMPTEGEPS